MSKVQKVGFEMLPIEQLVGSQQNPRFTLPELEELMASIEVHGIIAPVVVEKQKDGTFKVLDGHRRAEAAARLQMKQVPCAIRPAGSDQVVMALVANTQRADLTPLETAIAVGSCLSGRKTKQKQLAAELGKSETWVSKFATISKAYAKIPEDAAGVIQTWKDTTDSDKLYRMARKALGLDKDEQQQDIEVETGAGGDGDQERGEVEVIRELEALAVVHLGYDPTMVAIKPAGNAGFQLLVLFKSEAAARKVLDPDWKMRQ